MARIDGKPKMVSERYLGSAENVVAAVQAGAGTVMPERTRHLGFGDLAAVWGLMDRIGVAAIIDEVTGGRLPGAGASVGTYLAVAAANPLVAPCSQAAVRLVEEHRRHRFTKIPASVLDHRRFWDAMRAVSLEQLTQIEHRLAVAMVTEFGLDTSALALDMTNFATYIDSTNDKAPIAQRGRQAEAHRPAPGRPGPGGHPRRRRAAGLTRLPRQPPRRHPVRHRGRPAGRRAHRVDHRRRRWCAHRRGRRDRLTAVVGAGDGGVRCRADAGANFAHLHQAGLRYVGSVPPSDVPDLLALPARRRAVVNADRFGGLTALETRREVYGADRRVVLTHSPTLHAGQARGLDQTLAKAGAKLTDLAATLARGNTRRDTAAVTAEITTPSPTRGLGASSPGR